MTLVSLVLATALPEYYRPVAQLAVRKKIRLFEAEEEIHGFTHAQVGAYLLAMWGLPPPIVSAVAHHHRPQSSGEDVFGVVSAVHVADCLSHEVRLLETRGRPRLDVEPVDTVHLREKGALQKLPGWRSRFVGERGRTDDPRIYRRVKGFPAERKSICERQYYL